MSKIDGFLIENIGGLKQHQIIDLRLAIKAVMIDFLNSASKDVFDSGVDREVLTKVYNEMLLKLKKE